MNVKRKKGTNSAVRHCKLEVKRSSAKHSKFSLMARQNVVAVATSNDAEKQLTATGGLTGILLLNLF